MLVRKIDRLIERQKDRKIKKKDRQRNKKKDRQKDVKYKKVEYIESILRCSRKKHGILKKVF